MSAIVRAGEIPRKGFWTLSLKDSLDVVPREVARARAVPSALIIAPSPKLYL